jgi:hypothetical protein
MILERERIEGMETMERALEHYGTNAQMLKCIEEMGELSRALARALNPNEETDQANICEEIADVSILLDQLYLYFGKEYIMRLKLATLKRLKERMDAEERAEDEEEHEEHDGRIEEFKRNFNAAMDCLIEAANAVIRK